MTARYETFAKQHLHVVSINGSEAMVRCIFHEDSNASMQFNVEKGLFICFGCGVKGSHKKIQRELGIRIVEEQADVGMIIKRLKELKKEPVSDDLPVLGEEYLKRYCLPTKYWAERGFTESTIRAFDLGVDPMGDFASIPIRNMNGQLLGIIKRYLGDDVELKYKYPKGFKRSLNMFGSWMVEQDMEAHTVVLTEGSLDAIKVWQAGFPAMAVYGSSISPTQIRILRRLGIRKVILFFDNDKAGYKATIGALGIKIHTEKSKAGKAYETWEYDPMIDLSRDFLVDAVRYVDNFGDDPGEMDDAQIKHVVTNAKRVSITSIRRDLPKIRRRHYSWK